VANISHWWLKIIGKNRPLQKRNTEFEEVDVIEQHKVRPTNKFANLLDIDATWKKKN
jgi:hypothetical protein